MNYPDVKAVSNKACENNSPLEMPKDPKSSMNTRGQSIMLAEVNRK